MNSMYGASLTGMRGAEFQLDVVANDIANLNTSGFETVEPVLTSLPAQAAAGEPDTGATAPLATHVGMGVRPESTVRSQAQAPLVATGNPLDLAIGGQGFFALRQANGQLAYTQQLSLHLDPNGRLATADGLSPLPPIQVPSGVMHVVIDGHGALVGLARNGQNVALGRLSVVSFAAPENLRAQGGGLYTESLSSGRPQNPAPGQAQVFSGYQLGSTVDLSSEMVTMIQAERMYEANGKALQTVDSLINTVISIQPR